jgi:hypothetical protein
MKNSVTAASVTLFGGTNNNFDHNLETRRWQ